jgi:hypothetical protein
VQEGVFCFDQTSHRAPRYARVAAAEESACAMYTSAECLAFAEERMAEVARDDEHRKRLDTSAEGWLLIAKRLRELEELGGAEEE